MYILCVESYQQYGTLVTYYFLVMNMAEFLDQVYLKHICRETGRKKREKLGQILDEKGYTDIFTCYKEN